MAQTDVQYRLVIFDQLDDPQRVRDLFAEVPGPTRPTPCSGSPGSRGSGRRCSREADPPALDWLYQLEIAAEAWRSDAFPDVSRPRTIHEGACLEGGFRVTGLRGEPTHWAPWDKVELIAAGRIAADDEFREVTPPGWVNALSTGFRAAIGRAPRAARKARAMRIPATRSARSSSSAATPGWPPGSSRTG